MDRRGIVGGFAFALLVQSFVFMVSAISSFVVPKVLDIEQFGYWQLFLFYVGYVGFAQLGVSDGVYLRYGGTPRADLPRRRISGQLLVLLTIQLLLAAGIALMSFSFVDDERRIVWLGIAVLIPVLTTVRFIGFLFQAMNETRLYSVGVFFNSAGYLILAIPLLIKGHDSFEAYVFCFVGGSMLALLYLLAKSRDLFSWNVGREGWLDLWMSARAGIKLLLASLSGVLILGAARFMADLRWGIETFAQVSLAITVITFFLTLLSQASMVLFPALRMMSESGAASAMIRLRLVALVVFPISLLAYFPICRILEYWLPDFDRAFELAAFLMPVCIYEGLMQVVYGTAFKVLRKETALLGVNLIGLIVATSVALVGAYWFHSLAVVMLATVIACVIRCALSDAILGVPIRRLWLDQAVMFLFSLVFVLSATAASMPVAVLIVSASYCVLLCAQREGVEWVAVKFVGSIKVWRNA